MKPSAARIHPRRSARSGRGGVGRVALPGLLAGLLLAGWCLGQPAENKLPNEAALGQVKDFYVPDYYDPPNQNQMKSLLRGAEAQPQPDRHVLIKELQLETYAPDGKPTMIVRAPDCIYDVVNQTASSTNHIEARTADNRLIIEGDGFHWEQTNAVFFISNRVHTIIRQDAKTPAVP
jgi:hypothetical protein